MADLFKVIINGNAGVGKSSFLVRFTDDTFKEDARSVTINADFKMRMLPNFDGTGRDIRLTVYDTAGQEKFRTITSSFYRGAGGAILMYDVTQKESFEAMESWLDDVQRYLDDVPRIIVGNKNDSSSTDREVSREEGEEFAKKAGAPFFETSAKTGDNVLEVFTELTKIMLHDDTAPVADNDVVAITSGPLPKKKGGRCDLI